MTNIPTDLLRTFVLVVEQRSFTRAAKAQGMTQPAISAQIRRLQSLLGIDLFDKSAPGDCLDFRSHSGPKDETINLRATPAACRKRSAGRGRRRI